MKNLGIKHYGIILFTLATAVLHLKLIPDIGFTLNGLGYLGLLGAYFLPIAFFQSRHKLVWWVLFGYTLLTIILWVIMGEMQFDASPGAMIGYYAKAAEVALLILLWIDKPAK